MPGPWSLLWVPLVCETHAVETPNPKSGRACELDRSAISVLLGDDPVNEGEEASSKCEPQRSQEDFSATLSYSSIIEQ